MADDYLATPVNKLGAAPQQGTQQQQQQQQAGNEVSYQDLLRKHEEEGGRLNSNKDTSLVNTQMPMREMHMPSPAEELIPPPMGSPMGSPMGNPDAFGGGDMQGSYYDYPPPPPPRQGYMQDPPPPAEPVRGEDAQPQQASTPAPWWKTWILQNKMGWIAAIVVFLVLTFVYPKVRAMPRFAQHSQMPHWVVGAISVLAAGCMTSINIAI